MSSLEFIPKELSNGSLQIDRKIGFKTKLLKDCVVELSLGKVQLKYYIHFYLVFNACKQL